MRTPDRCATLFVMADDYGLQPTELPRILREYMDREGLGQAEMAWRVGLNDPKQIQRWLKGQKPHQEMRRKLAAAMGIEHSAFYPPGTFDPEERPMAVLNRIDGRTKRNSRTIADMAEQAAEMADRVTRVEQALEEVLAFVQAQSLPAHARSDRVRSPVSDARREDSKPKGRHQAS